MRIALRRLGRHRSHIGYAVIAGFCAVGLIFMLRGLAATGSLALEAENGTLSGAAVVLNDSTASGGKAVRFGSGSGTPAPGGLQAFAGGNSINIRWSPASGAPAPSSYNVFRNGVKIASTTPGGIPRVYSQGTRYNDAAITPGTSYTYQVQAVAADGQVSALSTGHAITAPVQTTPVPTITVDTTEAPDLATWMNTVVVPELKIWYPKISDRLAYPAYTPPRNFAIVLKPGFSATGQADAGTITINADYARNNPDDIPLFIHESAHILQSYGSGAVPSWIVEGMASWTSHYLYGEDAPSLPTGPYDSYTAGYSPSSYFLNYIQANTTPTFIRDLNIAAHGGTYTSSHIQNRTGKTADQWWTQMTGRPISTKAITAAAYTNICVDDYSSLQANGNKVQNWVCNGTDAQNWSRLPQPDGTSFFKVFNQCMHVQNSGTADGTLVQIWGCNGTNAQRWQVNTDRTIRSVVAGKCLYNGGGATSGTQLTIRTCNAADPKQQWNAP